MTAPAALSTVPTLAKVRTTLAAFGRQHPEILRLEVFGSVARNEASLISDVDVVVSFATSWLESVGGFEYFGHLDYLQEELAARLGRSAHLVDRDGVINAARIGNHSLPTAVARDGQVVYEACHAPD